MSEDGNSPVRVTLKAGTGYDAPWIVVSGDTVDEVGDLLTEVDNDAFLELVTGAAGRLGAVYTTKKAVGAVVIPDQRPAPAEPVSEPSGGTSTPSPQLGTEQDRWNNTWTYGRPDAPACNHGPMVHKVGTYNGRPYSGFYCLIKSPEGFRRGISKQAECPKVMDK